MDFSQFDKRNYPTVSVQEGYGEWAATYEDIVQDAMDLRLLERIKKVPWNEVQEAADFACGTGRIGAWLQRQGVRSIDGVDLTAEMLEKARSKGVYRRLFQADVFHTPLQDEAYDLVTISLADEHLPDVRPLYQEAYRVTRGSGSFVLVGYHPFFMMGGVPTHYHRASGEPATIETYVHLFSDHVQVARAAGWSLAEMHEGLIDEDWLAVKPKWSQYLHRPVSFVMVWKKYAGG